MSKPEKINLVCGWKDSEMRVSNHMHVKGGRSCDRLQRGVLSQDGSPALGFGYGPERSGTAQYCTSPVSLSLSYLK